jgi:hypothetical protein
MTGTMKVVLVLVIAAIVIIESLKESSMHRKGDFFVLNRGFHVFQLIFGCTLFTLLNGVFGASLYRCGACCVL